MRPPGPTKRQKELARADKKREKAEKRAGRRIEKEQRTSDPLNPGEDPDLAGIVVGPQPTASDVS
ncbi:MAG: hypothetical protein AAB426_06860 [Myxococcota bacterium]